MKYVTKTCSDNAACQYNTYVIHELMECILPENWWDSFVIYLAKSEYFK